MIAGESGGRSEEDVSSLRNEDTIILGVSWGEKETSMVWDWDKKKMDEMNGCCRWSASMDEEAEGQPEFLGSPPFCRDDDPNGVRRSSTASDVQHERDSQLSR